MFAQPFHDPARKRLREEDPDAAVGSCGFSEHRAGLALFALVVIPNPGHELTRRGPRDGHGHGHSHSSFAPQLRGATGWSGPGPVIMQQNGLSNMGHVHSTAFQDRTVPRTMQTGDGWHSDVQRRIPSPISEVDSSTASPGMCLESGASSGFPSQLTARLEQSTLSPRGEDMGMMDVSPSFSTHAEAAAEYEHMHEHEHEHEHEEGEDGMAPLTETISAPATPSPGRSRGHMRSHHTINTWTWQPGMKKSFSIGYRADCEKCRLKVPGHFNHIIVS
ncbi:hypothetical protein EV126DRAFT_444975 [Verticillium dahliae]|nr:hypothetical protein EV126DRAFT_444975 [Verticillium dahliae]